MSRNQENYEKKG